MGKFKYLKIENSANDQEKKTFIQFYFFFKKYFLKKILKKIFQFFFKKFLQKKLIFFFKIYKNIFWKIKNRANDRNFTVNQV